MCNTQFVTSFKSKEITMKQLIAIIASVFALASFAADVAPTAPAKVEKKAEVKPVKSETKAPVQKETTKAPAAK